MRPRPFLAALISLAAATGCGGRSAPAGPPVPAIGRYSFEGVLFEGNTRLTVTGGLFITADTLVMEVPGTICRQHEGDADRVEIFCVTTEVNVVTRQRAGFRFVWHRAEPTRDAGVAVITRVDGWQRFCPEEPLLGDCYMKALALSTSRHVPLTLTPAEPAPGGGNQQPGRRQEGRYQFAATLSGTPDGLLEGDLTILPDTMLAQVWQSHCQPVQGTLQTAVYDCFSPSRETRLLLDRRDPVKKSRALVRVLKRNVSTTCAEARRATDGSDVCVRWTNSETDASTTRQLLLNVRPAP
jgi:hypothetical protein